MNGKRATVDYENAIVGRNLKSRVTTLLAQHEVWTKKDGSWKGVSDESSAPGIPEDLTTVTVTLRDDAPIIVPTPLPKTDVAFLLQNTGAGAKNVFILGLHADLDVATLIPQILAVAAKRGTDVAAHFPDGTLEMGRDPGDCCARERHHGVHRPAPEGAIPPPQQLNR